MILVISVQDYLNEPLVALVKHLYGDDTDILAVRANRKMSKWLAFKIFFYLLPFRLKKIFTPSDLGGRLVRLLVDLARFFGVEVVVVPAHNHVWRTDPPLPLHRRYLDLDALKIPGAFARHSLIVMNDDHMRSYYLSMGYDPRRLVAVPRWLQAVYGEPQEVAYPVVFFTEVLYEIDEPLCNTVLRRVQRMLDEGVFEHLFVKLHPRETAASTALYHRVLGAYPNVTFLDPASKSTEVIRRTGVAMACISTVLLEALWLGRRIIVFDNPRYERTLLRFYLDDEDFFLYGDETDADETRAFCHRALRGARCEP